MKDSILTGCFDELPPLLRGEVSHVEGAIRKLRANRILFLLSVILVGGGLYGACLGIWRAPRMAFYTGIKFPLIILLTTLGNALLNGMLAPLLGLNLRLRESLLAILMSFAIATAILGSFCPILLFIVWNMPGMEPGEPVTSTAFAAFQLSQVAVITFAGVAAHVRLMQFLRGVSGSAVVAWKVLIAWLAGNLFLGSQLTWILRPLFGAPHLPIEFLRPNALEGNFYETVFRALRVFLSP